jgi:hypothetical protein
MPPAVLDCETDICIVCNYSLAWFGRLLSTEAPLASVVLIHFHAMSKPGHPHHDRPTNDLALLQPIGYGPMWRLRPFVRRSWWRWRSHKAKFDKATTPQLAYVVFYLHIEPFIVLEAPP